MKRLPVLSEPTMRAALDAMRMVEQQAAEHIVIGRNAAGALYIEDGLAPLGSKILWVQKKTQTREDAEARLDELRRRRVVLAIVATLPV